MKKNILLICLLFISCASLEKNKHTNEPELIKTDNEPTPILQNASSDLADNPEQSDTFAIEREGQVEFFPTQIPIQDKPNLELVIPQDDEAVSEETVLYDDNGKNNSESITNDKADEDSKTVPINKTTPPRADDKKNQSDNNYGENKNSSEKISENTDTENKPASGDAPAPSDNVFTNEPRLIDEEIPQEFSDEKKVEFFSEFPSTEPDNSNDIKVSRSVKLKKGQRLEITYPGEGWVYLGELSAQKGIKYQQRKLQNNSSLFHFGTEKVGTYILNFSHFDAFSDKFISDAVLVEVEDSIERQTGNTIAAPPYINDSDNFPLEQPPKIDNIKQNHENAQNVEPEKTQPVYEKNDTSVYALPDLVTSSDEINADSKSNIIPEEILQKVEQFISAGDALSALNKLEEFFVHASSLLDKALFLRGKAYEINGKEKNIKLALKAYRHLCDAYPESPYWNQADERIRYINRFYININ